MSTKYCQLLTKHSLKTKNGLSQKHVTSCDVIFFCVRHSSRSILSACQLGYVVMACNIFKILIQFISACNFGNLDAFLPNWERNKTDAQHSKSHPRLLFFPLLDHTVNASRNSVWSTVIGGKITVQSAAHLLQSSFPVVPPLRPTTAGSSGLTRIIKMSFPKIQRGAWMTAAAGRYARKYGVATVAQGPPLDFWRESQRRSNLTEQTWAPPEGFLIKACSKRPPVSPRWNQSSPPRAPVPKSKVLSLPSISRGVSDSPLSGIWCLCTFLWASRPLFACSWVLACTRLTLGSANLALLSNVDINHLRTTN